VKLIISLECIRFSTIITWRTNGIYPRSSKTWN